MGFKPHNENSWIYEAIWRVVLGTLAITIVSKFVCTERSIERQNIIMRIWCMIIDKYRYWKIFIFGSAGGKRYATYYEMNILKEFYIAVMRALHSKRRDRTLRWNN